MKHPLHKFSKKNRNIISGLLVGIAAIAAVVNYAKLPREEVFSYLFATAVFVIGIIVLAIITIFIFKGFVKLKNILFN